MMAFIYNKRDEMNNERIVEMNSCAYSQNIRHSLVRAIR